VGISIQAGTGLPATGFPQFPVKLPSRAKDLPGAGQGDSLLFGYRISRGGLSGDVAEACRFINSGRTTRYLACANPHSLVVASRDKLFSRALQEADLLIPDGSGILLAARSLNQPIAERVAGTEFFHGLTSQLSACGGARYFFLGSSEQVLSQIAGRMSREYPEITVCGLYAPPFKAEFDEKDNTAMLEAIRAARPDVLWVGMTAPKQEKWISQHRDRLEVPFVAAIGAVFDFFAGTKQRPSRFWRRLGMEWFPRFLREPRRLWERNLRSAPLFLFWIVREKLRGPRPR
jgi:N-acetylglucosaminyldiphosphoundecaprenol N-acetyl-beta-D-mannosaminyltransferase